MRHNQTIVLEDGTDWSDEFSTRPAEVGGASEALFFLQALEIEGPVVGVTARVQISPDGKNWCDEGTLIPLPSFEHGSMSCAGVLHFGNWLRLAGRLPGHARLRVRVSLELKE